jgi:lysophospholipase L1-like esterase
MKPALTVVAALLAATVCATPVASGAPRPCTATHWIGAWAAAPSDASQGTGPLDRVDASGNAKLPLDNQTVRAVLTPSYGGRELRVRLSNRFGTVPVTFGRVTVARRSAGAALVDGTATPLRFKGKETVTVPAGQDVLSDAAALAFDALQTLAVDVYIPGDAGMPTEHFTARQTSYLTPQSSGDQTAETSGQSFSLSTTARPYVTGVDVTAPAASGAVVAFGDSITDGFQGYLPGVPETTEGLDADARYPDHLARRLGAAGVPLSVLNTGISGNKVLSDANAALDVFGPSALKRLDADVLAQSAPTTVIWLEGINDLGGGETPDALVAGYEQGIARMRAAGLRVLLGTLTPSGGATGAQSSYGTAQTNAAREQVNAWIRTQHSADGIVDFDVAVRDSADPSRLASAYDGGDHLHLSPAGHAAMAAAVPLDALERPGCASPVAALTVRLSRRSIVVGRTVRLRVSVRRAGKPVHGALVRLGRFRARTDTAGTAVLRVRFTRPRLTRIIVTAPGARSRTLMFRVRRARG